MHVYPMIAVAIAFAEAISSSPEAADSFPAFTATRNLGAINNRVL